MKYGRKERGHYKGKSPKQGQTNAEDLAMELPEGRESSYHRFDQDWGTFLGCKGHSDNVHSPGKPRTVVLNSLYNYFTVIGDIITFVIYFYNSQQATEGRTLWQQVPHSWIRLAS